MKKNDFFSLPETQQRMVLEQAAIRHNLAKQAVEKDLWVTAIIQIIFTLPCADSLVFKGGTSLSKVWGLINRFSEDIDLSMNRKPTESERKVSKELIVSIADSLGMTLMNPDKIRSRHDYNMYVFTYESLFASIPMEIIIETSYYQTVYPVEKHEVGSFVGKFCVDREITLPIPFEAAHCSVQSG